MILDLYTIKKENEKGVVRIIFIGILVYIFSIYKLYDSISYFSSLI